MSWLKRSNPSPRDEIIADFARGLPSDGIPVGALPFSDNLPRQSVERLFKAACWDKVRRGVHGGNYDSPDFADFLLDEVMKDLRRPWYKRLYIHWGKYRLNLWKPIEGMPRCK